MFKKGFKVLLMIVLVAVLLFTGWLLIYGQSHPAAIAGDTLEEQIRNYTERYVKQSGFSGTVLVAEKDRILFHNSYGLIDAEEGIPNTNDTQYRIASITKIMTAAAIAKLEEEGKLSLEDSITRFFPEYAEWKKIKVKHLLAHSSGLTSYELVALEELKSSKSKLTNEEITKALLTQAHPQEQLEMISKQPLSFDPGKKSDYKNANYLLLGLIIEQVTGQPYSSYLRDQFFIPAQMANTVFDEEGAPHLASPHADGQQITDTTAATLYSFGGAISTASDVHRFIRALQTGELISEQQFEKMGEPLLFNRGYGWMIGNRFDEPSISHGGDTLGFASHIIYFPDSEYCVIVLSNTQLELANAYGGTFQVLRYMADTVTQETAHNLAADLASLLTGKRIWVWDRFPGSF
ncbi:serine hydrolase domain-containing protein [Paenibacillus xylaniclasticus]|uniref:serine hydrolase domain-containing protein n=1 Tax=Paenibacillus xylaniclasticus TaxID=588083 RepID=UPI0013DEBB96|nr:MULTISPECIES: serine hydrolase domain-containing protein [Paenibacillus]